MHNRGRGKHKCKKKAAAGPSLSDVLKRMTQDQAFRPGAWSQKMLFIIPNPQYITSDTTNSINDLPEQIGQSSQSKSTATTFSPPFIDAVLLDRNAGKSRKMGELTDAGGSY